MFRGSHISCRVLAGEAQFGLVCKRVAGGGGRGRQSWARAPGLQYAACAKSCMDKFRPDEGQKLESTRLAGEANEPSSRVNATNIDESQVRTSRGTRCALVGATWQQPTGKPPPHHPPAPASTGLILRLLITGRSQLPAVIVDQLSPKVLWQQEQGSRQSTEAIPAASP